MRLAKVAYKKIATHLDKTELACRLHYHQLSHGGNRRKRTNSLSSNSSDKSAASPVQTPTGALGSPTSSRLSPISPNGAIQKLSVNTPSKIKGKPLLPKPADGSGSTPSRKQSSAKPKQLRVDCDAGSIDRERLQKLVEAQHKQFWTVVAAQYGGQFTAEYLEQCWHNGLKSGPPTPAISPQSKVSSPISSCIPEEPCSPATPESAKMDTICDLPTPQPLSSTSITSAMAPAATPESIATEPSSSENVKSEVLDGSTDVTMTDIPEVGESENSWSE